MVVFLTRYRPALNVQFAVSHLSELEFKGLCLAWVPSSSQCLARHPGHCHPSLVGGTRLGETELAKDGRVQTYKPNPQQRPALFVREVLRCMAMKSYRAINFVLCALLKERGFLVCLKNKAYWFRIKREKAGGSCGTCVWPLAPEAVKC